MCDDEKRRSIRIRKPLAVQFSVESPDGLHWDESLIRDISENGMCLNTGTCMKAGEICVLRIRMPLLPQSFLELRGRVIDSVASRAIFLTR
ncbi:MAG: PilZ domain-containing protein, partial [Deltaproteobacteria bacterium]